MILSDYEHAITHIMLKDKTFGKGNNDYGTVCKFGISLRFLKNLSDEQLKFYGIFEEPCAETVNELTIDQIKKIYKHEVWDVAPFEKIFNQEYANTIFAMAISMGIAPAIKCVQRACWAVMKKRELIDDGILTNDTLETIKTCGFLLMPAIRSERAGYYRLEIERFIDEPARIDELLNRAYCS